MYINSVRRNVIFLQKHICDLGIQIECLKDQIEALVQCKASLKDEVDNLTRDLEEARMGQQEAEESYCKMETHLNSVVFDYDFEAQEMRDEITQKTKV